MDFTRVKLIDNIYKTNKKEQEIGYKFHQIIEKDKQYILNCYRNHPLYQDSISKMEKASKGRFFYKRMVRNGLKRKPFFIKAILESISKLNKEEQTQPKQTYKKTLAFKTPELDLIKKRKLDLEKRTVFKLLEKQNEELKFQSHSNQNSLVMPRVGNNILNNLKLHSAKKSSRISSGSVRLISATTKNVDNISTKNKSLTRSISSYSNSIITTKRTPKKIDFNFPEQNFVKLNSIVGQCRREISVGSAIGGRMQKYTDRLNLHLSLSQKARNRIDKEKRIVKGVSMDKRVIEEKIPKKKYKTLEIEKYNELKRKLDEKISDGYIYFNRKEYQDVVKYKDKKGEYQLFLEDINKINEGLVKKKVREKKKLIQIDNLLEYVRVKKYILKNKIDISNYNRQLEKKKEDYLKKNVVVDENYFLLDEKKPEEQKGALLPKLLAKRDEVKPKENKEKAFIKVEDGYGVFFGDNL